MEVRVHEREARGTMHGRSAGSYVRTVEENSRWIIVTDARHVWAENRIPALLLGTAAGVVMLVGIPDSGSMHAGGRENVPQLAPCVLIREAEKARGDVMM